MTLRHALTPLLVGLGLDELSVSCGQVPRLKQAIRQLNEAECLLLADEIMSLSNPEEIRQRSRAIAERCHGDLLG